MEISSFSSKYRVRVLTENDIECIYELCRHNASFYEFCPPLVTHDTIRHNLRALPPKKTMDDKYYLGFFDEEHLIAVMDFIDAYPTDFSAFLGFFMVDASMQCRGVGSFIIEELCSDLQAQHYQEVRLGWVKGNRRSEAFCKKNGFQETGVSYDTDGYTVIVAQRML